MKNTHYYIVESFPDKQGRQPFAVQWYLEDQACYFTQHFYGILQDYLDRAKERGIEVEFTDQLIYNYI